MQTDCREDSVGGCGYSPASLRRSRAHTSSAGYRRWPPGVRTDGIRPRRAQSVTARSDTWKSSATSRVRRDDPACCRGARRCRRAPRAVLHGPEPAPSVPPAASSVAHPPCSECARRHGGEQRDEPPDIQGDRSPISESCDQPRRSAARVPSRLVSLYDVLGVDALGVGRPSSTRPTGRERGTSTPIAGRRARPPERLTAEASMQELNAAWAVLSDPVQREEYDRAPRPPPATPPATDDGEAAEDDAASSPRRRRGSRAPSRSSSSSPCSPRSSCSRPSPSTAPTTATVTAHGHAGADVGDCVLVAGGHVAEVVACGAPNDGEVDTWSIGRRRAHRRASDRRPRRLERLVRHGRLIDLLVPRRGGSVASVATYEFRCRACGATFEERRPMAEADRPATCPDGHSTPRGCSRCSRAPRRVGRAGSQPGSGERRGLLRRGLRLRLT